LNAYVIIGVYFSCGVIYFKLSILDLSFSMIKYVGDGIHKIIDLIHEIWELAQSSTNFSTRVTHFRECLQKDLENHEWFYKEFVGTFATKFSIQSNTHRREQIFPLVSKWNRLTLARSKRIKFLREMLFELEVVKIKRYDLFIKLVDLTKELNDPNLLMDTILMYK
jgi:hypothetical protein